MRETEFYQTHLNRVSRSFAFCIEQLEEPFRKWVSLSYLLCRVVDTVEDSLWRDVKEQQAHFDAFGAFLKKKPDQSEVTAWVRGFPESIPEGELLLLQDAFDLFSDLHELPANVRQAIVPSVNRMREGMIHYTERTRSGGIRLSNLKEVNRYCFFVAGVVGELLTRLYQEFRPEFSPPQGWFSNGCRFGLFLQKVNLLKDQATDEKEGRFLIPDRSIVFASLRRDAEGAFRYLLAIPTQDAPYRVFCAWSLYLGLASLPYIQASAEQGQAIKIPREVTQELLAEVNAVIRDDAQLTELFRQGLELFEGGSDAPESGAQATVTDPAELAWFERHALGVLSRQDLVEAEML